jgi:hypothetical protein
MKSARLPLCFLIVLALFSMVAGRTFAADLSTWHLRNIRLASATSGNGIYVAVGKYGFIVRSIDGTTWTKVSSWVEDDLSGVAYGNGVFVTAGSFWCHVAPARAAGCNYGRCCTISRSKRNGFNE